MSKKKKRKQSRPSESRRGCCLRITRGIVVVVRLSPNDRVGTMCFVCIISTGGCGQVVRGEKGEGIGKRTKYSSLGEKGTKRKKVLVLLVVTENVT